MGHRQFGLQCLLPFEDISIESWAWRNNKAAQTSLVKNQSAITVTKIEIYTRMTTYQYVLQRQKRWSTQLLAGNRNTFLWKLPLENQVHVGLRMRTILSSSQICLLKKISKLSVVPPDRCVMCKAKFTGHWLVLRQYFLKALCAMAEHMSCSHTWPWHPQY